MNKLLPILLVVVLSGCGGEVKTPLENCADSFYKPEILDIEKYAGTHTKEEYHEEWPSYKNSILSYEKFRREYFYKIKELEFSKLPLKEKLNEGGEWGYIGSFRSCERERKGYPETFDAKWK